MTQPLAVFIIGAKTTNESVNVSFYKAFDEQLGQLALLKVAQKCNLQHPVLK